MPRKLSISSKLFLSNLAYGIPIATLVYFVISTKNESIDFAKLEVFGNEYQKPLSLLLNRISEHGVLAQRSLAGDARSRERLSGVESEIDKSLQTLETVDQRIGKDLQFTDEGLAQRKREHLKLSTLKKEWDELKSTQSSLTIETSTERHLHLVADLRGMITHSGDTSNLILDPDLDSYYLMDITLAALPQMQDRIQEIIVKTEPLLRRKQLTSQDRVQTAVYAALLKQSDLDRSTGDAQTSLNEDKNFYELSDSLQKNLPVAMSELSADIEAFLKVLGQVAEGSTEMGIERFSAAADKALAASFKAWNTSVIELDKLLDKRIQVLESSKRRALAFSLLGLFFAAVIGTFLGLSIRKTVIESISSAVSRIKQVAQAMHESNQKLAIAAQTLSTGTTHQASAVQETVATLNEINAMVEKSVGNADSSSQVTQRSQKIALEGQKAADEMKLSISEISQSNQEISVRIEQTNREITEIVKLISEIGSKTKIINDIVFQTKLLSFNASVEAARAGEHGKGFAVVAEEVGNLAQMSGNAAKEISEMLETSISTVNRIVEETRQGIDTLVAQGRLRVENGVQLSERCSGVLAQVVETITQVTAMMAEITEASKQQAQGVNEITRAMNQLDETTNQNAADSQLAATSAANLAEQADLLKSVVQELEQRLSGRPVSSTQGNSSRVEPLSV